MPTFGEILAGTESPVATNKIQGSFFAISEDGVANSITAWLKLFAAGNAKCAIYKKSDNSLVAGTEERSLPTYYVATEITFNFASSPSLVSGTEYYLVAWFSTLGSAVAFNETNRGSSDLQTYGAWPDPWVPVSMDYRYSIYCTYTAGGGGVSVPVMMHHYKQLRKD